jgi:tetratricopeptide (TPR) repeat protein
MNRQQFINYIHSPERLNAESLLELENLVKEYPFFQTSETLLALNLLLENNIKFSDQLKLTSAYAADRRLLRQQLNILQKSKQPGNKQEFSNPVASSDQMKTSPVKGETPAEMKSLAILINQLKSEVDLYMIQAADQKSSEQFAKLQNLAGRLEKIIGSEVKSETPRPPKTKTSKRTPSAEYNLDHLEETPVKKSKQLTNADLIDKFIKDEPRIVPKPTFFDPLDSARHSIMDNETVVSETLAEIYYKQGNHAKAIKIYKKLSLVNPQKSSYFAAQIEKIQKEIK